MLRNTKGTGTWHLGFSTLALLCFTEHCPDLQAAGLAVAITRTEFDAAGLRRAATRAKDAARRMSALALVLDGRTRTEAADICGMDRQTL